MSRKASSTAVQVTPHVFPRGAEPWIPTNSDDHPSNEIFSKKNSADLYEDSSDDDDDTPTINDVESLRKGIIKTSKNVVQAPYTILLVGETGVGKSAILEFIANVLIGNTTDHYDFEILDRSNEQAGSKNQSQTNAARFYKLTSKNGMEVHILDTPGLADTRGFDQDERHKKSIATEIQKHIDSVTAVLILVNGTVQRLTVGTDYALSTLSAIFPKSLVDNIAFLFTNVPSPLSWNFSEDTIPLALENAELFLLDNPIALQKRYLSLIEDPSKKRIRADMRTAVQAGEDRALEMLVNLFDWLDGLGPQPTTEIVYLYNLSQTIEAMITNTLAQMDQATAKKVEFDRLMATLEHNSHDMNALYHFENTITRAVWKQQRSSTNNMICGEANCYSNCEINYESNIPLDLKGRFRGLCDKCNHNLWNHHRCRAKWEHVVDMGVLIDEDVKRRWVAAKDGKKKKAVLVDLREKVLRDLGKITDDATNDLAKLVKRYTLLALSGSFSAQVGSAVKLLEQNCTGLEKKGIDREQLEKVKESLEHMKRRLGLLNDAKEKSQKQSVGIRPKVKKLFGFL